MSFVTFKADDGWRRKHRENLSDMTIDSSFTITPARSERDIEDIATLFRAYVESLGLDLSFQSFEHELASLPGKYAPPSGELYLARDSSNDEVLGCVAVRPLDPPMTCEMKRLYTTPAARGRGVGRALARRILDAARGLGYSEMRLDSLPTMGAALSLYKSFGFVTTDAYYETPLPGTVFMSCDITQNIGRARKDCP